MNHTMSEATNTGLSPLFDLDDSFVRDVPELSMPWQAAQVPEPELLVLSEDLAVELGLDLERLRSAEGVAILAGNDVPSNAEPVAMGYAGHQFGGYSPRLGDGRALLLGELVASDGRFDLHLKGSGRTPFARGGDGKAAVGPMLREYVFAEAMHALGVPTGRALAVVATGEQIIREGHAPGAILTRVASSHIRVGTFEYAVRLEDKTVVRRLADHTIARHYPAAADLDDPYIGLLEAVIDAQASLVARWMLLGFIHGVLNTDNVALSGETIDYGPCAFMDRFDPATVFSSIDHGGRYAYGNQPSITAWNLTRLAETLIPLIDGEFDESVATATELLNSFPARFHEFWIAGMRAKFGLAATDDEQELFDDFLGLLHTQQVDYTSSFRALAASLRDDRSQLDELFSDTAVLDDWIARWREALGTANLNDVADAMDAVNPVYIPRNHLVEEALAAAESGDLSPFNMLLAAVTRPFVDQPEMERFAMAAPESFNDSFQTFCGT